MRPSAAFVCVLVLGGLAAGSEGSRLILVENGKSLAPIVLAAEAPPDTRRAADDLAVYLEKTSGARPAILAAVPDPVPSRAIWVGYRPQLAGLFRGVDFTCRHPEEIVIAANARHLAITGRDRTVEGRQVEYGTANAVYTFLQRYLGVRWLWPGELGEDVVRRRTIALAPFMYRYHPQFRQRDIMRLSGLDRRSKGPTADWTRRQRLYLRSLAFAAGHAFSNWWDKYHVAHPEYFALQPDGTRSGYPKPRHAKLCQSSSAVRAQWLDNVARALRADPGREVFNAAPNDGHSSGLCVCQACRAWDHPRGPTRSYTWKGRRENYVAMTDRYVTFWNHLSRELKARFPGRQLYVSGMAYGPAESPPVAAKPADNVLIGYVGHFPFTTEQARAAQKREWQGWAAKARMLVYRPNLWYWGGGVWGLPEVAMTKTIEDFRFLVENRCVGIVVDTAWEHWATQGPQYYLMGQLAWNPGQYGTAVMADYYRRGFGPAAADVERYWALMEQARDRAMASGIRLGGRYKVEILGHVQRAFEGECIALANACLRAAEAKVAGGPDVYRRRVAFVRAGLEYTTLVFRAVSRMAEVRESRGTNKAAVDEVVRIWKRIEAMFQESPEAFNRAFILSRMRSGYMGGMLDHFGPPSEEFLRAAASAGEPAAAARPAPGAEWELAFADDFQRDRLGDDWRVLEGDWSVSGGCLLTRGGRLISSKGFPGFQRLEFDVTTAAKPFSGTDLSSFVQARPDGDPVRTGYFFQFGGYGNKENRLRRAGEAVAEDETPRVLIAPNRKYRIVVENDGGHLRLIVDGQLLLEYSERVSIVGPGQGRVGFLFGTPVRVDNVRVYVKPLDDGLI